MEGLLTLLHVNVSRDVVEFFKRIENMNKRVAEKLDEEHEGRENWVNQNQNGENTV